MHFNFAQNYENYAKAQAEIVIKFSAWFNQIIINNKLIIPPNIIEIGCGTGFLSQQLNILYPKSNLYLIDNAPNMLNICEQNLSKNIKDNNIKYILADAQNIDYLNNLSIDNLSQTFIISSMCMQWFNDISYTINQYLQHTKYIAFTIPTKNSFDSWQKVHQQLNIPCAIHQLLSLKEIYKYPYLQHINLIKINMEFNSCIEFMHHFKHIGAYNNKLNYSTAQLKKLIKHTKSINNNRFNTEYEIAMLMCYK